jgi:hypothetical protein
VLTDSGTLELPVAWIANVGVLSVAVEDGIVIFDGTETLLVVGLDSPAELYATTAYVSVCPSDTPVSVKDVAESLTDAICA